MENSFSLTNILAHDDLSIEIIILDPAWQEEILGLKQSIINLFRIVFQKITITKLVKKTEFSISLVNNEQIEKLNAEYLHKIGPTNVLSFPTLDFDCNNYNKSLTNYEYLYLGEIIMSYEFIKNEAIDQQKSFINHFIHLLLHGLLHLLGFDHQNNDDALQMERSEIDFLAQLNIASPY